MVITQNGEPKAVLQDPESYDNMRKAITLLKLISEGEENIKHGQVKSQEKVFEDIEKVLAKRIEWTPNIKSFGPMLLKMIC